MRKFNGVPKEHFGLFLKNCEWRFNNRPTGNLLKVLLEWAKMRILRAYLCQTLFFYEKLVKILSNSRQILSCRWTSVFAPPQAVYLREN